jgi:hypothetical protein
MGPVHNPQLLAVAPASVSPVSNMPVYNIDGTLLRTGGAEDQFAELPTEGGRFKAGPEANPFTQNFFTSTS